MVLREATGTGRMSDLLLEGVPYDVYTPTAGNLSRVVSAIAGKGSQVNGGGVVLDLSKSRLTGVDPAVWPGSKGSRVTSPTWSFLEADLSEILVRLRSCIVDERANSESR